jgi:hypothetical protein
MATNAPKARKKAFPECTGRPDTHAREASAKASADLAMGAEAPNKAA